MKMESVQKINEAVQVQTTNTNKDTKKTKEVEKREALIEQSKSNAAEHKEETMNRITVDQEKLKKMVEQLKESVPNAEPKFGVHEGTNRMMVKLVDKDTQKVIKEFPLEKTLDSIAISQDLAGTMLDTKL